MRLNIVKEAPITQNEEEKVLKRMSEDFLLRLGINTNKKALFSAFCFILIYQYFEEALQ